MYEISLVPEVKAELLRKQKMRNLVILICVGIAIACGAILLALGAFMGQRKMVVSSQDTTIQCLYDGKPKTKGAKKGSKPSGRKCKKAGTPIMNFNNMQTLLTMQDQLDTIDTLNKSRLRFSRIFGLLDVLLINMENGPQVRMTELNVDFMESSLSLEALGYDLSSQAIGYRPLEAFQKNAALTHYDYGNYMRKDEDGNYVEIPEYCMEEVNVGGLIYGIYHRGASGCEAPMLSKAEVLESELAEEEKKEGLLDSKLDKESKEDDEKDAESTPREDIYILRTVMNEDELDEVKSGDIYAKIPASAKPDHGVARGDYYFDSKCTAFGSDGRVDENLTLQNCPVLETDGMLIGRSGYGRNRDGELVLTFDAVVKVSQEVFLAKNHHMQIVSPSRRNVTDSYNLVRPMFASSEGIVMEEKK